MCYYALAMNIKVQLVDKLNNQVIYYGVASVEYENAKQKITFKDENYKYIWKIFESGLIIESISEVAVFLTLRKGHQTKGHIDSQFGQLDLNCFTSDYKINENCIEVAYQLIQGDEKQEFQFELNIFKEGQNAVH